jgi:hypothetical protein
MAKNKIYESGDVIEAHGDLFEVHSHTSEKELLARDKKRGGLCMVRVNDIKKHWPKEPEPEPANPKAGRTKYLDVTVRLELPEDTSDENIDSWLLNRFNATSTNMSADNPLEDADLVATSAHEVRYVRVESE